MDAYLFDLDGTLIDSRDDIAASANHARRAVGLSPRPVAEIHEFIGEGAQRLIERTLGPEHQALVPEALAAWKLHYEGHMLDSTRAFPGIVEALGRMPGNRAVLTNKPGPSARKLIQALGLSHLLPVVIGGGDVPSRKPDPEGARLALSRLPEARRVVLVGDSAIDAETALNAGFCFCGVLWGLRPGAEMEAKGARVFASAPAELPQRCLEALAAGPIRSA